jgi:hypothetical protein
MLSFHCITSAFHRTEKHVHLIAYGPNAARLVLPNKSNCSEPIPPGRIYFVKVGESKEIITVDHREAILKVDKDQVYLLTTYLEENKAGDTLQHELKDKIFNELKKYWSECQVPAEWIERDRTQLTNFGS